MTMLTDLHDFTEAERNAVCAELARMLRIVPINPSPVTSDDVSPLPVRGSGVAGDLINGDCRD